MPFFRCRIKKLNRCKSRFCFLTVVLFLSGLAEAQVIPRYKVNVSEHHSSGFYFMVPIRTTPASSSLHSPCHLILDEKGDVVYYKQFEQGTVTGDFRIHANGLLSYYYNKKFYLMDKTFTIADSVACKNDLSLDGHEFQILPNGHFLLMGYENITKDLSSCWFPKKKAWGSSRAQVKSGVIQEQDANKNVVFEWHSKNYYNIMDVDTFFLTDTLNVDWTHFNAVEYDSDGNYLVSVRNFNEISKIKRNDSTIMWRLGGSKNQYTFKNDTTRFLGQHDIRRLPSGNITLFDNGRGGTPIHPSSAKEYKLDEKTLTASLIWSFTENTKAYSVGLGSVERFENGNTLVNYGTSNKTVQMFSVVNPGGEKTFEIFFADTLRSYRAYFYKELPWNIQRPVIRLTQKYGRYFLETDPRYKSYHWSDGSEAPTIEVKQDGIYTVTVPFGQGGFLRSSPFEVQNFTPQKKNNSSH